MGWMVPISILLLSTLMIMLLLKMGNTWKTSSKDFPPGPRPLPVVGNLHIMDWKKPYQTLSEGTHIIPLLTSVLHDESQWEKPYTFYPEHFLNTEGKFVKRDAFMPFSAGKRACPGETLARTEMFMFFTSLLQSFTFQPAPGLSKEDLDMTCAVGLTTAPKTYMLCPLPHS